MEALQQYDYPGNVRELEHIVERAAVHASGRAITADQVRAELRADGSTRQTTTTLQELMSKPYHEAVAFLEEGLLRRAMQQADSNKSEAARLLRINRRLLYEKLALYRLP